MRKNETFHTSSAPTYGRRERRAHAEPVGSDIYSAVYKRSYGQRRPPHIPPNYSGNAFLRQTDTENSLDETENVLESPQNEPVLEDVPSQATESAPRDEDRPSLFGNGLKSEELLLLALILIVSQGGGDDVLPYLVMLLFAR